MNAFAFGPSAGLPRQAIRYLAGKGIKPSSHWTDVWREEHALAFTAARMGRDNLLIETHAALVKSLAQGGTMAEFSKTLAPRLAKMGWAPPTGTKSIPWRLRRIYDSNMRSAYSAGQWQRIQTTKEALPFLLYELGPSRVHRDQHVMWAGTLLPADDAWWDTHFPPNGWGCKCRVRQVGQGERDRLAKKPGARTSAPPAKTRDWINKRTGEAVKVPVGIDPGWDWNPGQHRPLGMQQAWGAHLDKLLRGLPAAIGETVTNKRITAYVSGEIFRRHILKKPTRRARPADYDPKAATAAHVPIAVLPRALSGEMGARNRILRLTNPIVEKQYWRHGEGLKRKRDAGRKTPPDWYADIPDILRSGKRTRNIDDGRWQFDDRNRNRRLVLDLDDQGNPVLIAYHPKKFRS